MRLIGGCAAVSRHHLAVMRLGGNFVAVNYAAAPRLGGITLAVMRLFGDFVAVIRRQHLAVLRLFVAIICCVGIQPERLNAEDDSLSALSRGCSVSATPGMLCIKEKRLEERECCRRGSRNSRSSHYVGWHDTEGFASLHPRL